MHKLQPELVQGTLKSWMQSIRRKVGKGNQDKQSFVHFRMGNMQSGSFYLKIPVKQSIQIKSPILVAAVARIPPAPKLLFNTE